MTQDGELHRDDPKFLDLFFVANNCIKDSEHILFFRSLSKMFFFIPRTLDVRDLKLGLMKMIRL